MGQDRMGKSSLKVLLGLGSVFQLPVSKARSGLPPLLLNLTESWYFMGFSSSLALILEVNQTQRKIFMDHSLPLHLVGTVIIVSNINDLYCFLVTLFSCIKYAGENSSSCFPPSPLLLLNNELGGRILICGAELSCLPL